MSKHARARRPKTIFSSSAAVAAAAPSGSCCRRRPPATRLGRKPFVATGPRRPLALPPSARRPLTTRARTYSTSSARRSAAAFSPPPPASGRPPPTPPHYRRKAPPDDRRLNGGRTPVCGLCVVPLRVFPTEVYSCFYVHRAETLASSPPCSPVVAVAKLYFRRRNIIARFVLFVVIFFGFSPSPSGVAMFYEIIICTSRTILQ